MGKIGIIYGSSRPSTVGESVAKWFKENADIADHEIELIDIKNLDLPPVGEMTPPMMVQDSNYEQTETKQWAQQVKSFDAFVFVVAEYNLGYTPILKNSIDVLYHEWVDKPVAFISYGSYDSSTAVEQLRTVMSAFKTKQVDPTLHIAQSYESISPEGKIDETKIKGATAAEIANNLVALI